MAKILIADDEKEILQIMKTGLEKDGHMVSAFESASQIDKEKLGGYDLFLLDVMMPGTDGFTFCKQIRELVSCPILFLTAKTQEQALEHEVVSTVIAETDLDGYVGNSRRLY